MDWLGFQHRIRRLLDAYFRGRGVSQSRADSARNRATGEQAKRIDDAILDLWRKGRCEQLSEDEKDILAIRLNWAWETALHRAMAPFERIEALSETDFANVLINLWRESGRDTYQPWIVKRIGLDGNQIPEAPPSPNKQTQ